MRTDEPRPVRLADYRPPDFAIPEIGLDVALDPDRTVVKARMTVERRGAPDAPLRLDGEALELVSVKINGRAVGKKRLVQDAASLTIHDVPDAFKLEIETAFSPRENTALSGIYLSNERIFSQCEAEGFRRITYFLDRPDVLSRYSTRIEADKAAFPTMLSNGNLQASGELDGGRHYAVWRDPFPKPAYLFALVAGGFDLLEDSFTTMSGKVTPLRMYVDPGDAARAEYAMDALKRAMLWDERAFGREYDLDLFMIVAVRDFNFGAMENKGLNVFNSSLLLADPETATDFDYQAIESVVAHEYFHNWTGNRITCRDWFQLCLKEGLTVFRDQSFSAHERGEALARIKDVRQLRARQFPEDAGPLAHPVRPSKYLKIDNFYTATVYEKGAEVIRMLREVTSPEGFRAGMDRYFERYDGTAATIEEFLSCFAEEAGAAIFGFLRWYEQAGTPRLFAHGAYDAKTKSYSLTLRQEIPPTPDQPDKKPAPIPVRLGLLGLDGQAIALRPAGETARDMPDERVLLLDAPEKTWRFVDIDDADPAVSLLRGFSAPVILALDEPSTHRARRAASDPDPFNRWEAGQAIVRETLVAMAEAAADGAPAPEPAPEALATLEAVARDDSLDPGFAALALSIPDETEIAQLVETVDPDAIKRARETFMAAAGARLAERLTALRERVPADAEFSPDAAAAGRRALRNAALRLIAALGPKAGGAAAQAQLDAATNLTDRMAALAALDASGSNAFDAALKKLYDAWRDRPLLVDKWFAAQARTGRADAVERVRGLLDHKAYDARTPNRVRAVLGVFAMGNPAAFHAPDGAGYALFIDQVLRIDAKNPSLAARLLGALEIWPRLEPGRRALAKAALEQARDASGASKNVYEIASRSLSAQTPLSTA